MHNEVKFTIPGPPTAKQRPKFTRAGAYVRTYTPQKTVNYENLVKFYYEQAAKGFAFPDDAMLDVRILAFFEIPKSVSKKRRQEMLDRKIRPTKKPDCDNIGKIICDSINKIAYHDDASIVDLQVRKFYSDKPRVDVIIRQISY